MFFLTYIKCLKTLDSSFGQWGTFGHTIFEKYYKKELDFYELSDYYAKNYYDIVNIKFPPNAYVDLNEKYYNVGKNYFENFEGLYDNSEILGIEQEVNLNIEGYEFTGFIDLILKDDKGIFIVDHKSKSKFATKKEKNEYLIQLYLYSIYIYEKYGKYPYKLVFNMFRENDIIEEKFDIKALENAKKWLKDTIDEIYNDMEFKANKNEFFCDYICGCRLNCCCSREYLGE